jgi:hypothetical protein
VSTGNVAWNNSGYCSRLHLDHRHPHLWVLFSLVKIKEPVKHSLVANQNIAFEYIESVQRIGIQLHRKVSCMYYQAGVFIAFLIVVSKPVEITESLFLYVFRYVPDS